VDALQGTFEPRMTSPKKMLIERLVVHRAALQAFFYRRVNARDDAADMVQEVYLRMLRVKDCDALRNPEGYLFTVASNLVYERSVQNRQRTTLRDYQRSEVEGQPVGLSTSEELFDTEARVTRLREVLAQLSPKCRAAVLMKYQHGLNYEEIAHQLKISTHMVHKYLGLALAHCRRRMARLK
jgi:RNA polymerase sigma factor (sigma-70 family)